MNKEMLIEENNRKREYLTKENEKYYDDMLIYIRLSFTKSEQKTEEVLMELLDHLLEAQEEGRCAEDVFGDNPKEYVQEIIGELPKMVTKERTGFFLMIILYLMFGLTFLGGILSAIIYLIFDQSQLTQTYYLGSLMVKTILNISAAFLMLYGIMFLLKWTCFKNINKILEFILYWIYGVMCFGFFFAIAWVVPTFGPQFDLPIYAQIIFGAVLYPAARYVRKKI